jgi:hypothetical protein
LKWRILKLGEGRVVIEVDPKLETLKIGPNPANGV